jgi:hypothetical protein
VKGPANTQSGAQSDMTFRRKISARLRAIPVVTGLLAAAVLAGAPQASATSPGDAPAGYGGPVGNCGDGLVEPWLLYSSTYQTLGSYLDIFYSTAAGGTFCAKTLDYLDGAHYMSVAVRRGDWVTKWYDTGTYSDYAGGIQVFGAAGKCVYFYGLVTVNGVKYEGRLGLTGSTSPQLC